MKRGLVVLDPTETPAEEWQQRIATLQQAMRERGLDVALVYGDVSRSDDIAYLTNLCIYWNEGVLAVPVDGPVTFLTKLSLRVQQWMKRSSTVTEFGGGKDFADMATAYLQDREPGTLGLVDAALWPGDVVAGIETAVTGWRVERVEGLVREQRLAPSAAETALLRTAGRLLDEAVTDAAVPDRTPGSRVEAVERALRRDGFLDLYPATLATSDGVTSFGVTGQYRTGWVHASRLVTDDARADGWPVALRRGLGTALAAARTGAAPADLDTAATGELAALPAGARTEVSWIDAADLSSGGELRGSPSPRLASGAVGTVRVEVTFADGGHAAVAETVRITDNGPEHLTGARP